MKELLKKEFKWFVKNHEKLVKLFDNKYVVIVGKKIRGAYDTQGEALEAGMAIYGLGKFMIQLVTPGDGAYTAYIA